MRAAFIRATGPADSIMVDELPNPVLSDNQVLVKVQAVAVDPVDTYIRSGRYPIELKFPFIVGRDMVGTVMDIGAKVQRFHPGDRVWCNNQGYDGRQGTFAEYLAVDQHLLYFLPGGAEALNVVASVHSGLTACVGLHGKAQLQKGETLFINGGSGNVGNCAIQLAKHIGARVAVTSGSQRKAEQCQRNGADLVIDYKTRNVSEEIRKFAPDGVNVYWDLAPQPDVVSAVHVLGRRGRIILSSGLNHVSQLQIGQFYTRNCTMYGFTITDLSAGELSDYAIMLNQLFQKNVFNSVISRKMCLDETATAHRLVEESAVDGKIVITL